MDIQQLVNEISNLPISERVKAVDQILQTFNRPDPEVEEAWAKEARRRLDQFENGGIEAIPGEKFEQEVREKYSQ